MNFKFIYFLRYRFILVFVVFFSCSSADDEILVINSGEAQGTYYHIKYMSSNGKDYNNQIDSIIQKVDSSLSIYKDFSLISKLNNYQNLLVDTLFKSVYIAAEHVFLQTKGYFDCTVSPLVNAWGFYNQNLDTLPLVDSLRISLILKHVGFQKIELISDSLLLPKNMKLDFNALAQGFTIDLIADYFQNMNVINYMIEIGGEVIAHGKNDRGDIWKIGIDKPLQEPDLNDRFQLILNLENKALATSGSYRKFYEVDGVRYSHTINPFNGFPTQNKLLSVSVVHSSCMLADAYATAFMVMGVRETKRFVIENSDIDVFMVYLDEFGDMKNYISPNMQKRVIN